MDPLLDCGPSALEAGSERLNRKTGGKKSRATKKEMTAIKRLQKNIDQHTDDLIKDHAADIAKSPKADTVLQECPWYLPALSAAFKAAGKNPEKISATAVVTISAPKA